MKSGIRPGTDRLRNLRWNKYDCSGSLIFNIWLLIWVKGSDPEHSNLFRTGELMFIPEQTWWGAHPGAFIFVPKARGVAVIFVPKDY